MGGSWGWSQGTGARGREGQGLKPGTRADACKHVPWDGRRVQESTCPLSPPAHSPGAAAPALLSEAQGSAFAQNISGTPRFWVSMFTQISSRRTACLFNISPDEKPPKVLAGHHHRTDAHRTLCIGLILHCTGGETGSGQGSPEPALELRSSWSLECAVTRRMCSLFTGLLLGQELHRCKRGLAADTSVCGDVCRAAGGKGPWKSF